MARAGVQRGKIVSDSVHHPKHYDSDAKCSACGHPIECVDVAECLGFNRGNAVKYIWRAGRKGSTDEDLRKAIWYLERERERVRKQDEARLDGAQGNGENPTP
jgi:hypothetical protein